METGTKSKYIFLDRDGVIVKQKHLLHKKEDIELLPKAAEAIQILNDNGFTVIVITNQPVVARGLCTEKEVKNSHKYMKQLLEEEGAHIDAIYYCPHHPIKGEDPKYTKECNCRKPEPGMILQAQTDFGIPDLSECFMIGDKIGDIKCGDLAGCKTILVSTGYGGDDGWDDALPQFRARDLLEAVEEYVVTT
jgi:histidinol-phosphate phosphatase family protein